MIRSSGEVEYTDVITKRSDDNNDGGDNIKKGEVQKEEWGGVVEKRSDHVKLRVMKRWRSEVRKR